MNPWANWTAKTVLVTTGFAASGGGFAGVAYAGTGGTDAGNVSVLSGNQVSVPVSIPIDICGNAAAVLGIAIAGCQGGAEVVARHGLAGRSGAPAGNLSVGSGNSVQIPVKAAANVCGNAVGNAQAGCQGGAYLPGGSPAQAGGQAGGQPGETIQRAGLSAGNVTAGSGNRVRVPVSVPANVCGNAAAVLGDSNAGCAGGAIVVGSAHGSQRQRNLLSSVQLAGLGTLPGLANLPTLAGLASLALLRGLTSGGPLLPASALSAFTSNVEAGGMSGNSFVTLTVGALLAGVAALKLAGRRSRARKAGSGEASA